MPEISLLPSAYPPTSYYVIVSSLYRSASVACFGLPESPDLITEPRIFDSYRRSYVIYFEPWRVTPLSELVCRNIAWLPKWLLSLPHAFTFNTIAEFYNPWPCTEQLDAVTKPTIAHKYIYRGCQKMYTHFKKCYLCKMCIHFLAPSVYIYIYTYTRGLEL